MVSAFSFAIIFNAGVNITNNYYLPTGLITIVTHVLSRGALLVMFMSPLFERGPQFVILMEEILAWGLDAACVMNFKRRMETP